MCGRVNVEKVIHTGSAVSRSSDGAHAPDGVELADGGEAGGEEDDEGEGGEGHEHEAGVVEEEVLCVFLGGEWVWWFAEGQNRKGEVLRCCCGCGGLGVSVVPFVCIQVQLPMPGRSEAML